MKMFKYVGVVTVMAFCGYSLYAYKPQEASALMREAKNSNTSVQRVKDIQAGFMSENRKMPGTYTNQINELKGIIEGRKAEAAAEAHPTTRSVAQHQPQPQPQPQPAVLTEAEIRQKIHEVLLQLDQSPLEAFYKRQNAAMKQELDEFMEKEFNQGHHEKAVLQSLKDELQKRMDAENAAKGGAGKGTSAATGPLMKPDYAKLASAAQGLGEPLKDKHLRDHRKKLRATVENKLGILSLDDLIMTIKIGFNEIATDINTVDASKAAKIYDRYYKFTFASAMAFGKNPSEAQIVEIRHILKTVMPQTIVDQARCDAGVGKSYKVDLNRPNFTDSNEADATPECAIHGLAAEFPLYQK